MKIVIAIDSFKGCLSSEEANHAAADGVRSVLPKAEVREVTVSDGGEGFVKAYHKAVGGIWVETEVCDPLMRPVKAHYLLNGNLAVLEMAEASGLSLLSPEERNPMLATTYGTGQLIVDAIQRGACHIIIGLGGSATNDAGMGMLLALTDYLHEYHLSNPCTPSFPYKDITLQLRHVHFTMASDVRIPLYGPCGAAHVFGSQKGATPEMIRLLDERARLFAERSARFLGYDHSADEGAGAAGGVGYAMLQYLHADNRSGIDLLLDATGFTELAHMADLIITGEGSADRQTLMGKLPMGILHHASNTPVCLFAGRVSDREALLNAGFAHVECINPPDIPLSVAMRATVARQNIRQSVQRLTSDVLGARYCPMLS
ncbi:MAG: glycerate kinase [Bacteroidaceae bacterium]|nr:glycerate kinase [Bacteroidaceae bacterium]